MAYKPQIGTPLQDMDTPALLIDLDALERNIQKMAAFFEDKAAVLRPHIKTHKCPQIAHRQLEAGAIGITCAKVSEAEVMAEAGLDDILIANQVNGPVKIDRLTDLARRCDLMVAVDDLENVAQQIFIISQSDMECLDAKSHCQNPTPGVRKFLPGNL